MRIGFSRILVCGLLAASGLTGCATKQIESLDERILLLNAQLERMEEEVKTHQAAVKGMKSMEQEYATSSDKNLQRVADFNVMVEGLRNDVALLRGRIEENTYFLNQLKKDVDEAEKDFDFRLDTLEKQIKDFQASGGVIPKGEGPLFERGMSEFNRGNFKGAIEMFDILLKDFPKSEKTEDALFWRARAFEEQSDPKKAISMFQKLVTDFPKSDKRCEAVFRQGHAFEAIGKPEVALLAYKQVVDECKDKRLVGDAEKRVAQLSKSPASEKRKSTGVKAKRKNRST